MYKLVFFQKHPDSLDSGKFFRNARGVACSKSSDFFFFNFTVRVKFFEASTKWWYIFSVFFGKQAYMQAGAIPKRLACMEYS